jgi:hypothetical protein
MSNHDGVRMEGLDSIQRLKPLAPDHFVALREIEECVVVNTIPEMTNLGARSSGFGRALRDFKIHSVSPSQNNRPLLLSDRDYE